MVVILGLVSYCPSFALLILTLIIAILVKFIVHLAVTSVWDLFDSTQRFTNAEHAIQTVSAYKWIEYTFSASFMHIVICHLGGVHSAHELVLCVACLSCSMLFVNMSEAEVRELEHCNNKTGISIRERVDQEVSFVFLSFCAKGVLSLALTIPWLYSDGRTILLDPAKCTILN
jgi:hypothetical protein